MFPWLPARGHFDDLCHILSLLASWVSGSLWLTLGKGHSSLAVFVTRVGCVGPAGSHMAPEGNWRGRILASHMHKCIGGQEACRPLALWEKGTGRGKEVVTPLHLGPRMCDFPQSLFLSVVWAAQEMASASCPHAHTCL